MSRNLDPSFRGKKLMLSGFVEEGLRVVLVTPDVLTDNDYHVATNLTAPGPVAVSFPVLPVGFRLKVWDQKGDAATNNVTITPYAGETINGAATFAINVAYGCVDLIKESATNWKVVALSFVNSGAGAVIPSGVTFTQTYSTSSTTVPTDTSHAITDSTGGTPSTTALALLASSVTGVDGAGSNAASKANVDSALVIIKNSLSTLAAELVLAKADALATKKALNALIDAAQLGALVG